MREALGPLLDLALYACKRTAGASMRDEAGLSCWPDRGTNQKNQKDQKDRIDETDQNDRYAALLAAFSKSSCISD